jgi:hypothetical protein
VGVAMTLFLPLHAIMTMEEAGVPLTTEPLEPLGKSPLSQWILMS